MNQNNWLFLNARDNQCFHHSRTEPKAVLHHGMVSWCKRYLMKCRVLVPMHKCFLIYRCYYISVVFSCVYLYVIQPKLEMNTLKYISAWCEFISVFHFYLHYWNESVNKLIYWDGFGQWMHCFKSSHIIVSFLICQLCLTDLQSMSVWPTYSNQSTRKQKGKNCTFRLLM